MVVSAFPSMRSALRLAIFLVAATWLPIMLPAWPQSLHLVQLFPPLAHLSEITALEITVGWDGLSPTSPITGQYALDLHGDQFEGLGRFRAAAATSVRKIAVARDVVQAFLETATQVELVEQEYKPHITHTDDYPYVAVDVQTEQGLLRIESKSQCRRVNSQTYFDRTPWAINYSGRTFVISASDLDKALEPLLFSLRYGEIVKVLVEQLQPRWNP